MITIITKDNKHTITIDGILKESRTLSSSVTQNPVASGAKVSDNILIQPRVYSLEGRISPHYANLVYDNLKAIDFVKNKWALLEQIWVSKQPITIATDIDNFKNNMVIEYLIYDRDCENAEVLDFTATLKEIFIVETGSDIIVIKPGPDYNQGTPIKEMGIREAGDMARKKGDDYIKKILSEFRAQGHLY